MSSSRLTQEAILGSTNVEGDGALKAQERSKRRRRAGALNRLLEASPMSAFLGLSGLEASFDFVGF
jgi:hypothetical protein